MKNKTVIDRTIIATLLAIIFCLCACQSDDVSDTLQFSQMPTSHTGIDFSNDLKYDREFNIYTYRNFYNGGGVAIGDINGDTLADIYFSANMGPNKLYLNRGDFHFEDVTEKAGVGGEKAWSTGVTMVDINGDDLLDIYVCNSGDVEGDNKQNELFINQGDGTFNEEAERYGLADRGYSTHAAFFDYDKDGDLDCYLLNNSYQAIGSFNLRKNVRGVRDQEGGDKLYRNDNGKFVDVSTEAGIYGSVIGFGLGVTIGDINVDGWPDIYVSNDFFEKDYIYINNGDGTFSEKLEEFMKSISVASMGADMADINNDGYPEIFVTEMLPGEEKRIKTKTTFEDWDRYQYAVENDYYHQFTRNMLHLNNGNGSFSEIGRLAGVHATDWSWGALMADFDNDGYKDLFVSNGIYQDLTDQDFLNYISNEEFMKSVLNENKVDYKRLIDVIPSERIPNYLFHNQSGIQFKNVANEWGLATPSHSNGSAYGDLDNDGDLDLVVNNVNMPAFIYRNNTDNNSFLQIKLSGDGKNTQAIGTKLWLYTDQGMQYIDHNPMKGFESTMDYVVHFGVPIDAKLDSLVVEWPDGQMVSLSEIKKGERIHLNQSQEYPTASIKKRSDRVAYYFKKIDASKIGIDYSHTEKSFVDFNRDRLLYTMKSNEGPSIAVGDLNGDGEDDFVIGGASGQSGKTYVQSRGVFKERPSEIWEKDKLAEDMQISMLDVDNDGDLDLYVASGSNEFSGQSSGLKDRIYLNDGKGNFTKSQQGIVPKSYMSTSTVISGDYDNDGDEDLFVGERQKPFAYGVPADGFIIENQRGEWKNVTNDIAPGLAKVGLIRDATWVDINGDEKLDLIVVGEYMAIHLFIQMDEKFVDQTEAWGLTHTEGWWNTIETADLDNDGDQDLIVGNHGLNSRFKGSIDRPLCMHVNDFDKNGSIEQIICTYQGDKSYPIALRHDLIEQLPHVKKKYLDYNSYAGQTIEDIFTEEERKNMLTLYAREMASCVFINQGGKLEKVQLPIETQFSPIMAIETLDFNQDGIVDLVMGGNQYRVKPEIGRYDASMGSLLLGKGDGTFRVMDNETTGFKLEGEVRSIEKISLAGRPFLLVARNNAPMMIFAIIGQQDS